MYINGRVGLWRMAITDGKILLVLLFTVSVATFLHVEVLTFHTGASMVVIGALGTAISFFVAFFTAQAYARWWEARKIWGTLVNDSRSFGRMVVTLFRTTGDEADGVRAMQKRLVRRHIGFLYAVKAQLRGESAREYLEHLSAEEGARVAKLTHPANGLLELQGAELDAAERTGTIDVIRMAQMNDLLSRFSTSMGMAERIKLTVFPVYYESLIRMTIWSFAIVFPVALSENIGYRAITYSFLLAAIYLLVFRAGQSLLDPFEGRPADTPMSSIVRTIEINLLEQIGATDIPSPVEPIDGTYLP